MRAEPIFVALGKTLAVVLLVAWSAGPTFFILVSSVKPGKDIFAVPPVLTFEPTFAHYADLWSKWGSFFEGLWNSAIITVGATVLAIVVSTAAGYVYSRYQGRALTGSAIFLIVVRLLPPIVITLPLFPIVNRLGVNDTHALLIFLYAAFFVSLGTLFMRTFIDQIPRELDEAAKVDGASQFMLLWRIIAPLARQGMLALSVFVIVYAWNEFLFAFIFTSTRTKTAPLVVSEMLGSFDGVDWGILFAASSLQLLPVLLFVVGMQKYLVSGLTAGAIKG
jgi:multiple sugar transport system permease protein